MSEKDLQKLVLDFARFKGWRSFHARTSMNVRGQYMTAVAGDGVGFPDLTLCRERIVFVELKHGKNRLSRQQEAWRDAIVNAGGEWHEWRLTDWDSGLIEDVLG